MRGTFSGLLIIQLGLRMVSRDLHWGPLTQAHLKTCWSLKVGVPDRLGLYSMGKQASLS